MSINPTTTNCYGLTSCAAAPMVGDCPVHALGQIGRNDVEARHVMALQRETIREKNRVIGELVLESYRKSREIERLRRAVRRLEGAMDHVVGTARGRE